MCIENIFKEFIDTQASLNQKINQLNDQLSSEKNNSIAKVIVFYRENPDTQVHEDIFKHFGRSDACKVLKEIIKHRSLTLDELTPTLLNAVVATEWFYNNPHSGAKPTTPMTLAEDLFTSLDTDEKKTKLSMYACSTCDYCSLSESANKFLKETFALDSRYGNHGDKHSVVYINGYSHEHSTHMFSVSFTKESHKDIDRVVDTVLKLYSTSKHLCNFHIFEKDLCANGLYAICIESTESGDKVYLAGSFQDDIYFDGRDLREQLINACKYAADRYWYFNTSA